MDRHKRSIIKAFTWRAIATTATVVILFIATGSWEIAVGGGVIDVIVKLMLYYAHERAWNKMTWGTYN